MLVLIDESGCPGFKLSKGSTPYFVVGMVIFKNYSHAESISKIIDELKKTLGINPEFKFSKTRPEIKDIFFEKICQFDFEIRSLIVDKSKIYSQKLRTHGGLSTGAKTEVGKEAIRASNKRRTKKLNKS